MPLALLVAVSALRQTYLNGTSSSPSSRGFAVFKFPSKNEVIEGIKVSAIIRVKIEYPPSGKENAIVRIKYILFPDVIEIECVYSITKNDNADLIEKSDTVYYCVKMLEREFNLKLADHNLSLFSFKIIPVTYEGWMKGHQDGMRMSEN